MTNEDLSEKALEDLCNEILTLCSPITIMPTKLWVPWLPGETAEDYADKMATALLLIKQLQEERPK